MDRQSLQERFGIVGSSDALKNVIDRVRQVADTEITVLIQGESGVGKELIAEAVHALSARRHEEMVIVNCGAIPEGLIESELFGAEKGAYTGAVQKRSGYFEEADGGTIFLDEVGEMPTAAQVRLLRILETGIFSRVGSAQAQQTDVRVIAATNKDLGQEVEEGRFREDLYYRLSTVLIDVPPLREREEDILPIFEHFLHRFRQEYNSPGKRLTDAAERLLVSYRWPGNVRELRNVAEQAVVLLRESEISADSLRPYLRGVSRSGTPAGDLMPIEHRREREEGGDARGRELLYRAILELRLEIREMKEQLRRLISEIGVAVPRALVERGDFPANASDYVVMSGGQRDDSDSIIEDVVYEIEDDEPTLSNRFSEERAAQNAEAGPSGEGSSDENGRVEGPEAPDDRESVSDRGGQSRAGRGEVPRESSPAEASGELPTLKDAERKLIREALKRFSGNRRETARALGISERTLYRKLKDIDEDL